MNDFEEIANELNNDSNHIGKIIFIIFLVIGMIVVIFFGIDVLREKHKKVKEETEEEVSIQTTDFDCSDKCEYTFHINGKDVRVEYDVDLGNQDNHKIIINGNQILNQVFECGGPVKLIVIDDTFVLQYRNGCMDSTDTLVSYDLNGTELFRYDMVDEEYPYLKLRNAILTASDNKISFRATSIKNNMLLINNKQINICDDTLLQTNNVLENTVVEATYEIEYQGNLNYQKPKRKKTITLDRYKKLHDIDQSCNNN